MVYVCVCVHERMCAIFCVLSLECQFLHNHTRILLNQIYILTALLYGSLNLYIRQEHRLDALHICCLRHILGISWQDYIKYSEVLLCPGVPSMYSLMSQCCLQ